MEQEAFISGIVKETKNIYISNFCNYMKILLDNI